MDADEVGRRAGPHPTRVHVPRLHRELRAVDAGGAAPRRHTLDVEVHAGSACASYYNEESEDEEDDVSEVEEGLLWCGCGLELFVGSVGRGVQWDTVTEYHVVPVHRAIRKYAIIPSSPSMSH